MGITAVAAATTLLQAVLSLLGDRVDALRLPFGGRRSSSEGRFWGGAVSRVQRRPVVSLVAATATLVALALPALDLRTGSTGVRTIPDGYASKDGFNVLERELGVGTVDSVQIVVEGDVAAPAVRQGIQQLRDELATDPGFRSPEVTVTPNGDLALVEALVIGDSRDEQAVQAVERLRRDVVPGVLGGTGVKTYVTGETAEILDYNELMSAWLPVVFLFSVLFGLSMDYQVFLLLIDATLIRSVLVPAAMELLGDRNWYLLRWLSWLPHYEVEAEAKSL